MVYTPQNITYDGALHFSPKRPFYLVQRLTLIQIKTQYLIQNIVCRERILILLIWPKFSRWGLIYNRLRYEFLDAVPFWITLIDDDSWLSIGSAKDTINLGLFPVFEEDVLEETEEYRIYRGGDGVICKEWKHHSSIPHYIDFQFS